MVTYQLKYYTPAVLYFLLIITLSSLNQTTVAQYTWGIQDFILHVIEYNLFGVTLIWAIYREKPVMELKPSYRLALGVGALFAIGDEFYQSFIPTRVSTMEDVVADILGLILSLITFSLMMKIQTLEKFRKHA
jgi:VanZ family protein